MCTQEIVWCSCGHGEFFPIVKCAQAQTTGNCWTVIHGDHRVVLPMQCSYCLCGMSERTHLSDRARPEGDIAETIEKKGEEGKLDEELKDDEVVNTAGEVPMELDDVVHTDWSDFSLDPELFQYV